MMIVDSYRLAVSGGDPYFGNVVLQMDMQQDTPFLDLSSYSHTVTKHAGATVSSFGAPWGNSWSSDGSGGSRVSVTSPLFNVAGSTEWTFEVVYTPSGHYGEYIGGSSNQVFFDLRPGNISQFRYASLYHALGTLSTGVTYHLAAALDMSGPIPRLRCFVNGVLTANSTDSSLLEGWGGNLLEFGASGGNAPVVGTIQAVRLTLGACRYKADFTPPAEHFPVPGP